MSNLSIFLGLPLGILGFLFLFWKRLKEDYTSEKIFTFAFIVLIFALIGFAGGLAMHNLPVRDNIFSAKGIWFWGVFSFALVGFLISSRISKLRFFETLEAAGLGFIFLNFIFALLNSMWLPAIIFISLLPIYYLLNTKYRTFFWYKSGKVGFSGLAILALFFLIRAVLALIAPNMLFFVGKFDAILSLIVSFLFFVTLYNLGNV